MAPSPRESSPAAAGRSEFRAPTVEAALTAARAAHGADVEVLRAQRVRRGVKGLLGGAEEVVLQVAVPPAADPPGAPTPGAAGRPAAPAGSSTAVDDVLRALLARNDELDADPDGRATAGARPTGPAPVDVLDLTDLPTRPPAQAPEPAPAPETLAPPETAPPRGRWRRRGPRSSERPGTAEVETDPEVEAPGPDDRPLPALFAQPRHPLPSGVDGPRPAHPAPGIGTHGTAALGEPAWDVSVLHTVGVPIEVCRRLPGADPGGPAERVSVLAAAIAAVVPTPCAPGPEQAVALSGYGPLGALSLVQAGVAGVTPDRLYLEGGAVRATAHALAKGVLACVPR